MILCISVLFVVTSPFSFISALIFMISFFLLTLGVFCSSISGCFRCRVRLSIQRFSCFLRYDCISINLPLRTALTVSHRFWVLVFSLSFVSRNLLISFFISSLTSLLFSNVLFNLHEFVFFCCFFPVVDSVVMREVTWYNFNFLKFTEALFVTHDMVYPGEMFHVHLRRKCILHLDGKY